MRTVLLGALLALVSLTAAAQGYPAKPLRMVVPFPPGSTPDIVGRTLAAKLQDSFGQPVVVENRAGAGGNIGAEAVAKAAPDGHTLFIGGNGPLAINKTLFKTMTFDPDRDLAPISLLASAPQMLVVHPSVGVGSFKEFVDYVRRNPGRLSYASVGGGSASHLTMELLKSDAKVFIVHIPYRGFPPAVTDMLAGNIQTMFAIIPAVLPQVKAGKIKGIAVTGLKRSAMAPEVPSVAELGYPQLESLAWIALAVTAGSPPEAVERLSAETMKAMRAADTREALAKQGFEVIGGTRTELAAWIRAETDKWAKVIRASGATPD